MTGQEDPLDIAALVARALDQCRIEYLLTGSIASGVLGQPRFTRDIDFVVHLRESSVPELAAALGPDFDVDQQALAEAARLRSSWNIFHLPTMTRIDIFVLKETDYDAEMLLRRKTVDLGKGRLISMLAAEDSILSKLRWFQAGAGNDSKQMQDVVDVLRAQRGRLDFAYLDAWSKRMALSALLEQARAASGESSTRQTDGREQHRRVREILAGGATSSSPATTKMMGLLTHGLPSDAVISDAGFEVRWSNGGQSSYFAELAPAVVAEVMTQLGASSVSAPVAGLITAGRSGAETSSLRAPCAVWLIATAENVRLYFRAAPEEPSPATHAVPTEGPWRLPTPIPKAADRLKLYVENTERWECPACHFVAESLRHLADGMVVCPECGGSFTPG